MGLLLAACNDKGWDFANNLLMVVFMLGIFWVFYGGRRG